MDRFREMESLVAVVETGSFIKASVALRVSKAAVSQTIVALETRLGARLLQRTTRRVSLTEAGRAYLAHCKQILADVADADRAVGAVTGQPVGVLRINAPFSFGIRQLAPLWGELLARYPELTLEVSLADRLVDVVEEGFDAVIRISRLQDSSLVYRRLTHTRLVVCASPEYLAQHGTPTTVAALAEHRVIAYSYAAEGDTWHFAAADGTRHSVLTHPCLRTNNGDTCREVALAHQGIVLQPDFLVSDALASGQLVPLLPDFQGEEIGVYVVYPSRQHLSVKVRVLVDFLVAAFAGGRWAGA